MVLRELLVSLVLLEAQASPDQLEDLDLRDLRELLDPEALLVIPDLLELREIPVSRESLVTQDLREPPDPLARRAREEALARSAPLGLPVSVEPEELLELVVYLVLMEDLALLVCLVTVVRQAPLEPVAPLVMLDVLASLV